MPDRIDSIIDYAAIEAEVAQVEAKLTELGTTLKTFPKANIFGDASNSKDLLNANRQMSLVLSDLKVKNAELTIAIKEQNLAAKQAADLKKQQAQTAKDAADAAKLQAAAEKEAAKQAQIDGQERLRQLAAERKAQEDLVAAESKRSDAESQALAGTFTAGSSAPKKAVEQFVPTNASDSLALALIQDQRQLASTKEAQKLLTAEFAAGNISQAEYDAQLVKSIQLQQDLKISIANTTKELSLQARSNASIPGTIESLQTRNAVLTQQASQINVVNATPDEVAQLKAANDEIDKNNELIRINKDLLAQQKINIGNYPNALGQTFKTLNQELDTVQGKLVQGNFGGKEFDQLTAKQVVLQNALSLSGKTFKTTAAEASAYKEAALAIGQVYGKDSPIFKQFADGVKQGAANTAALANEVSGVASKGKTFLGFLGTAYNGLRKLAYAIPGIGIGGLILLLLGPLQAAGAALIKWSENATKAGRDFLDLQRHIKDTNDVVDKSASSYEKATAEVSKLTEDVKLAKEGLLDKNKVLKEYNDTMGRTTGKLKDFDDLETKLVADGPAYVKLMFLKAEATAAYALAAEAARKVLTASADAEKNFGFFDAFQSIRDIPLIDKIKNLFNPLDPEVLAEEGKASANQVAINADKIKKEQKKTFDDLQKQGDDFEKKAAELAKKMGFNFFPDPKKAHEDSQKLLDEFRKKDLEALSKFSNDELKANADHYKLMAQDEQLTLQERLDFEQKYYDSSVALLENQKKTETDALNLEADTALKNAKKIKDPKVRADTEIAINKYRTDQLKNIDQKFAQDDLKLNEGLYTDLTNITGQAFDKMKKKAEEAAKFIQDQQKIAFQNQKDQIDINKDGALLQAQKDFENGSIKSLDEYNEKKAAINNAADIEQKQLDLKRIQDAEKITELLYGVKNLDFIKQAKDLEVAINEEANKQILENDQKLLEDKKAFYSQLQSTLNDIIEGSFDAQKNKNDAQLKQIQDNSQKEIDAINASGQAQADKDKEIMAIQKQADFQTKQIQDRQNQADLARAKFERLSSIISIGISTAEAVAKITAAAAVARATYAAIPGIGLATGAAVAASLLAQIPFVIGTGALEVASVLAKPLPQFKTGTKNAPKGTALVSEEGSELVVDKYGKMFLTPKQPSLIDLAGGEQIFKHSDTEKILNHFNLLHILQQTNSAKPSVKTYDEKIYRELRKLNSKPVHITNVQNGMETSDYYLNNIKR